MNALCQNYQRFGHLGQGLAQKLLYFGGMINSCSHMCLQMDLLLPLITQCDGPAIPLPC